MATMTLVTVVTGALVSVDAVGTVRLVPGRAGGSGMRVRMFDLVVVRVAHGHILLGVMNLWGCQGGGPRE